VLKWTQCSYHYYNVSLFSQKHCGQWWLTICCAYSLRDNAVPNIMLWFLRVRLAKRRINIGPIQGWLHRHSWRETSHQRFHVYDSESRGCSSLQVQSTAIARGNTTARSDKWSREVHCWTCKLSFFGSVKLHSVLQMCWVLVFGFPLVLLFGDRKIRPFEKFFFHFAIVSGERCTNCTQGQSVSWLTKGNFERKIFSVKGA